MLSYDQISRYQSDAYFCNTLFPVYLLSAAEVMAKKVQCCEPSCKVTIAKEWLETGRVGEAHTAMMIWSGKSRDSELDRRPFSS